MSGRTRPAPGVRYTTKLLLQPSTKAREMLSSVGRVLGSLLGSAPRVTDSETIQTRLGNIFREILEKAPVATHYFAKQEGVEIKQYQGGNVSLGSVSGGISRAQWRSDEALPTDKRNDSCAQILEVGFNIDRDTITVEVYGYAADLFAPPYRAVGLQGHVRNISGSAWTYKSQEEIVAQVVGVIVRFCEESREDLF